MMALYIQEKQQSVEIVLQEGRHALLNKEENVGR
jgi:hypothetical protein